MKSVLVYVSFSLSFLLISSCSSDRVQERTPRQVIVDVADKLVEITQFQTYIATEQPVQDNSLRVNFATNFEHNPGDAYRARFSVSYEADSDQHGVLLGLSHSAGEMSVTLNGNPIDQYAIAEHHHWSYDDYGLYSYGRYVKLNLNEGINEIEFRFRASSSSAVITFGAIRADNGLANSAVGYVTPQNASHPVAITRAGEDQWKEPVLHEVTSLAGPLDLSDWRYFTGTFLDAMITTQEQVSGVDYSNYIDTHLDFFLHHKDAIEAEREKYGLRHSPFGHFFRYNLLDDIGMQAVPYIERIRRNYGDRYEEAEEYPMMKAIADFILHDADRLESGVWARFTPDTMSVWADDLFMGSILMNRMYSLTGDEAYINASVFQTIAFDELLRDETTGVYWHGHFSRDGSHSSSKWGRANGWTMMAKTDLLLNLPQSHPQYAEVLDVFASHARALKQLQSSDGRWHQILDNPDTYLETSCTAMFVRAFAEGVLQGWLEKEEFEEAILKGWDGVKRQIDRDGTVQGIVRGTPIMFSDEAYHNWSPRPHDPRGLGAVLLSAATMHRYFEAD